MIRRDERREAAIERMADYLLQVGLSGATLRPLALAAGTSGRMLLYYFKDRDDVLTAVLERIVARLTAELDLALPHSEKVAYRELLTRLWELTSAPELQPYMRLWLELSASASGDNETMGRVAGTIIDGFIRWIEVRLAKEQGRTSQECSALLLATLDGLLLLNAAGRRHIAEAALSGLN